MTEPTLIGHTMWAGVSEMNKAQQRTPVIRTGPRQPLPDRLRAFVLRRDGYTCTWCTSTHELQADHIIPWSAGGPDIPTNLRTLCKLCNEKRSNFRTDTTYWGPAMQMTSDCLRCVEDLDPAAGHAWCMTCFKVEPVSEYQLLLAEQSWARGGPIR